MQESLKLSHDEELVVTTNSLEFSRLRRMRPQHQAEIDRLVAILKGQKLNNDKKS